MDGPSTLLADLALVLGMAAITIVVCRRLHQPALLGYLLAGLIVGPYVPIPLSADASRVATLSDLGVVLVTFAVGLEFSVRKLLEELPRTGVVALLQVGAMLWLGYMGGRILGWTPLEATFAGAALCVSSTMIIARVFTERRVSARLSRLVFSVTVLQDFAAIVLIAVLTALASGTGRGAELPAAAVVGTAAKLLLFLIAIVAVGFLVVPRTVRVIARLGHPETLLVCGIGLCFGMAQLAQAAGFSVALGAFLAGSLVAESGQARAVEHLVRPLRDIFAAIFFVTVGMSVDPALLLEQPVAIALLVALVVGGTMLAVPVGAVLAGYGLRTAVQASMSLAQVGEFSFIITGIGVKAGVVRPEQFSVVVAVSLVTSFLSPWMARAGRPLALLVDRRLPRALQTYISFYGTWLESLDASEHRRKLGAIVRRSMLWIVLDTSLVAGIVIGTSLLVEPAAAWALGAAGIPPAVTWIVVLAVAGAATAPFVLGMAGMSRHLGTVLARAALPHAPEGRADFAAAPRRAYLVTVQLIVLLAGLLLLGALTQAFVPAWASVSLLVAGLGWSLVVFWRRAVDFAEHARAGAEVIADILARHADEGLAPGGAGAAAGGVLPAGASGGGRHDLALAEVQELMPGLGTLVEVRLDDDSAVVGRTLRQIDLRGATGATVFAIGRGGAPVVAPSGNEPLAAGDRLCLAGTQDALEAARELLGRRAAPEPLPAPAGEPDDGAAANAAGDADGEARAEQPVPGAGSRDESDASREE